MIYFLQRRIIKIYITLFIFLVTFSYIQSYANNINVDITSITIDDTNKTGTIIFNISWENSWRDAETNHDAAWVFLKYQVGPEIFKPGEADKNKSYFAKDLSLSVSFAENSIVNEFTLGSEFKGQTSKGLRIGDPVRKIFEIYGKADVVTPISFAWKDFVVFHKHDKVTHFRVLKK